MPLPSPIRSPLDGTYAKLDPSWPQWWGCRRCADYRPAGGIWKLNLDQGVLRIYYEVTGWRSTASFAVSGDRLRIFNDPYCPEVVAEYHWTIEGGELVLEAFDDACSFGLRSRNLSQQPWPACLARAAAEGESGLPQEPLGCEESQPLPPPATASQSSAHVAVLGGDSRFFERPPNVFASANSEDRPPPEGIRVSFHKDSIAYGIQRVLWWNGDWIEASTDLPFAAMGVQFLGEPQIGLARLLFDGVEFWRGNTSTIWSRYGRHGGYVEISGFGPGRHTLRAESLGFDYRPVTVASFGFSHEDGAEP
ncbi:MAG TPA: hypothetical protein VJ123_01695 [Anaerolineales bacterium]|nr:hypothetical protein [Anaerolineales bacterium]